VTFTPVSSIEPVAVTVSGTVAVSNFPATQPVSIAGTVLTDGSAHTQPVSGTVAVSNFPATQPVSGTVAVSNFPATQPVSGSVAVSNFPATQPVSGTVAVSGTVLTDGSAHPQPVTGPLTDTQLRAATVPVSGTVTADQGAGGPGWAVLQATDPWHVDASSYAVPVTVNGQPILVDGSAHTQPVSVASLPLPTGAATEDTLVEVKRAANDVALTAILEREAV